jgi:hypothetical protein
VYGGGACVEKTLRRRLLPAAVSPVEQADGDGAFEAQLLPWMEEGVEVAVAVGDAVIKRRPISTEL